MRTQDDLASPTVLHQGGLSGYTTISSGWQPLMWPLIPRQNGSESLLKGYNCWSLMQTSMGLLSGECSRDLPVERTGGSFFSPDAFHLSLDRKGWTLVSFTHEPDS